MAEVRHIDGIKGNFVIADRTYYGGNATAQTEEPYIAQHLHTNVKAFVELEQYFFETLWAKAIPAKQRIKEIEQGAKREFINTLRDPYEIQKILDNLVKSANEEILIMLPTITITGNRRLYHYEQEYLLPLLRNAIEHGIRLRLLVDESASEWLQKEMILSTGNNSLAEVQILDWQQEQQQNKVMTAIVDKELCLSIEVKDNSDDNYHDPIIEVIGLATYSNSESTVLSYMSIFETLWIQAELKNKQKNITNVT